MTNSINKFAIKLGNYRSIVMFLVFATILIADVGVISYFIDTFKDSFAGREVILSKVSAAQIVSVFLPAFLALVTYVLTAFGVVSLWLIFKPSVKEYDDKGMVCTFTRYFFLAILMGVLLGLYIVLPKANQTIAFFALGLTSGITAGILVGVISALVSEKVTFVDFYDPPQAVFIYKK